MALYVVALPIGNPKDITLRALEVLNTVDMIAAEDTRVFQDLANRLQIKPKQLVSHYDHNEEASAQELIKQLKAGRSIALVSDAGTPSINDPGYHLLRLAQSENIPVIPIPGPSSVITALSVSPLGGGNFVFMGYASAKKQDRREQLARLKNFNLTAVFFETPHRLREHLEDALDIHADPLIFITREMTKTYEEFSLAKASEHLEHFKEPRGEFVLIYPAFEKEGIPLDEIKSEIKRFLDQGLTSKDILESLKNRARLARQDLYDLIQEIKSRRS